MKKPPERSPDERSKRSERDAPARKAASLESPVLAARGLTLDAFGNRALLSLLRSGQLQRKARVSEPGDPLEHDADRAADEIVSGRHSHQVRPAPAAEIQRKPTEEETLTSTLGLDSESGRVAPADPPSGSAATPASGESGSGASGAPFNPDPPRPGGGPGPRSPTAHELMSGLGGGEPLPHDMRGFMESRFGESFEDVRIHAGDRAGAAASSVSARAFTVGSDIVFGPDEVHAAFHRGHAAARARTDPRGPAAQTRRPRRARAVHGGRGRRGGTRGGLWPQGRSDDAGRAGRCAASIDNRRWETAWRAWTRARVSTAIQGVR